MPTGIAISMAILAFLVVVGTALYAVKNEASASGDQQGLEGPVPDLPPPQIDDPISDAELRDLQTVASQKGISLQAAIDRYAWNDNLALAVAQVREAVPGAFAGAEIVDANNAWVAFKGPAPEAALEIINVFSKAHSGVSVEVRTDAAFTEIELQRGIQAVHFAVFERPEVRDAVTSHDSTTGKITTLVVLEDTAPDSVLDDLRVVAEQSLVDATREDILDSIAISLVRSTRPVGGVDSNTEHLGGEALNCTSGFGTKTTFEVDGFESRGISTAGHCDNPMSDDGASLTSQGVHEGNYGDFQWLTGPHTHGDDFYAGSFSVTETDRRDVAAVGSPVVGQSLCRNGRVSQLDCQQVRKLDVCNGNNCSLVEMGERLSAGGDSGGPMYWGNTAYGLHQGGIFDPFWPYDRDVFSRADLMHAAIGVWVATD